MGTVNLGTGWADTSHVKQGGWGLGAVKAVRCFVALVLIAVFAIFLTPTPAMAMVTPISLSSGGETTCAVMSNNNAYCWGDNTYGELGNGTTTSSTTPVLVSGSYTWASIALSNNSFTGANDASVCGVTTSGTGYCWGANNYGQVGDGTQTQRTTPTLVSGGYTWASIYVGWKMSCGVTTSNVGYCWGLNNTGQAGDGTTTLRSSPTLVSGGYSWAMIKPGDQDTCGVTTSGAGYCWGADTNGEVGDGVTGTQVTSPTALSGGYTWSQILPGTETACGVTTTNVGYCWGRNSDGEVGDNTQTDRNVPTAVSGGLSWSTIAAGRFNSCGVTTSGAGYCWGGNTEGQVGDNTTTQRHVPTLTSGGITFASVTTGSNYTNNADTNCGIAVDGIVYCWGDNTYGQIGNNTTTNAHVPTEANWLYQAISNTTASVTITPTFTFTVGNQSSACNGESNFVSGAGTASAVAFGNLAAGANVSGGQALTIVGNSGGGFAVYVAGPQATQNLRSAGHNWTDVSGTYASPAVLGAGEQFGYTYHDSTTSSSVTNPASANFIALTNANTNAVIGSTSSTSGSGCISYDAQTSASTPAASYTATVIYTAVPTY